MVRQIAGGFPLETAPTPQVFSRSGFTFPDVEPIVANDSVDLFVNGSNLKEIIDDFEQQKCGKYQFLL